MRCLWVNMLCIAHSSGSRRSWADEISSSSDSDVTPRASPIKPLRLRYFSSPDAVPTGTKLKWAYTLTTRHTYEIPSPEREMMHYLATVPSGEWTLENENEWTLNDLFVVPCDVHSSTTQVLLPRQFTSPNRVILDSNNIHPPRRPAFQTQSNKSNANNLHSAHVLPSQSSTWSRGERLPPQKLSTRMRSSAFGPPKRLRATTTILPTPEPGWSIVTRKKRP